jgi:hypothetical protein
LANGDGRISDNSSASSSIKGNGVATTVGKDRLEESDDDGGKTTSISWHAVSRFNEVTKIRAEVTNF